MGYYIETSAETISAAFRDAEPRDDGPRNPYEYYMDNLRGLTAEHAVCNALEHVREPNDDDIWEWDLLGYGGHRIDVKTKYSPASKVADIRTRGRDDDELADIFIITGYESAHRIWLLGYLTTDDVFEHGYHDPRTEHDSTLTVDFEHLRPIEDLFERFGRA